MSFRSHWYPSVNCLQIVIILHETHETLSLNCHVASDWNAYLILSFISKIVIFKEESKNLKVKTKERTQTYSI